MSRSYVAVGTTSDIGKVVAAALEASGHRVRPVSRGAGVSIDDAAALRGAFEGADGAFLMIPFDRQAPDLHARENAVAANLAQASTDAYAEPRSRRRARRCACGRRSAVHGAPRK
jgi:uncharacterized protein YbjT (DUF2867 family)